MDKTIIGVLLIAMILSTIPIAMPLASAQTLQSSDFSASSFAKTVDYFNFVRTYAAVNNITLPDGFSNYHAYAYMTYINASGMQLLYAGLENVTSDGSNYLDIPMQSVILHYKSTDSQDVVAESTFLMLMAFNESPDTAFPGSPTINDTLYASFSLGYDLSFLNASIPAFNSQVEVIPLTHSSDNLTWSWGMTYTNLTALWWRTYIDPNDPHFDSGFPVALTVYSDLSFIYNLTINPSTNTATLTESHEIGRITDMWLDATPFWLHYNSTGTYGLSGKTKWSNETVYGFLQQYGIEMSVVDYQSLIVANHTTYSDTEQGQNATQQEALVSNSSISTYSDNGVKLFNANFGSKQSYDLYNYTADPTESSYTTYQAVTRTASAADFAGNSLFDFQTTLVRYMPLVVAYLDPGIYAKAESTISDISKANYFYITSYPTYGGYKIVNDPIFTAYLAPTQQSTGTTSNGNSTSPSGNLIALAAIVVVLAILVIGALAYAMRRRGRAQPVSPPPP